MLWQNLMVASVMVVLTIGLHFTGLAILISFLRAEFARRWREGSAFRRGAMILATVLGLIGLHTVEIWAFAGVYLVLGEFHDLETSLYFSASTFTTLGYGDVLIGEDHRLVAAVEGLNGFLLIGWSTAFLVSVTAKMGLLEAQLEASQAPPPVIPRHLP